MRIAFHAPMKPPGHPTPSGDLRVAGLYWSALEQAGHRVRLASSFRSYEGGGDAARQVAIAEAGAMEAARLIAAWQDEAAEARPEAWFTYHLYHKAPDWLGPPVCRALGLPYLVAEPSCAPKQAHGRWAAGYDAAAAAIGTAAALFCPTRLDMACLKPLAAAERLHYLPPFLDPAPFADARGERGAHRRRLAETLTLDDEVPWLLAVGMMRRRDKLESYRQLGQALGRLGELPWQLVVVGDGEARPAVEAALAPLGARIAWAGRQPFAALPGIYAACDLYVWPAVGEAYGMALLEAAAAGLPAVAGRVRGVGDVVMDGATGLLAAPGDPADFAAKVHLLLASPAWRQEMGERAALFVARERSLAHAAARLGDELARAAANPADAR